MRAFQKVVKRVRNQLFKTVFFGRKCSCMFCGKTYRKFMHQGVKAEVFKRHRIAGAGFKKNVRCPHCGSNHRTRLLYLFFELRTDIYRKKVRLLHISPNRHLAHVLRGKDNIDYLCGALFPDRIPAIPAEKVDVTNMEFGDGQFDVVICNHVLEHVQEDANAMREIYRVLRPGGFAVLQVPLALDLQKTLEDRTIVDGKQRKIAYGQKDHLRLYGLDYFEKLRNAGFRVERDNPFENEWLPELEKYCLDEKEDVIVGFKS